MVSECRVELLPKLAGGPHHLRAPVRKVLANGLLQGVEALDQLGAKLATDFALMGMGLAEAALEQRPGVGVALVLASVEAEKAILERPATAFLQTVQTLVAGLRANANFLQEP